MGSTEEQQQLIKKHIKFYTDLGTGERDPVTEEQKQFVEYPKKGSSIILVATAGSGKTYSCVQRLKYLLSQGVDPSKIIFFSFTKSAVGELKERIGNNDIKITTIHSFALHILKSIGKDRKIVSFYDFIDWFKKTRFNTPIIENPEDERHELIQMQYLLKALLY